MKTLRAELLERQAAMSTAAQQCELQADDAKSRAFRFAGAAEFAGMLLSSLPATMLDAVPADVESVNVTGD